MTVVHFFKNLSGQISGVQYKNMMKTNAYLSCAVIKGDIDTNRWIEKSE